MQYLECNKQIILIVMIIKHTDVDVEANNRAQLEDVAQNADL